MKTLIFTVLVTLLTNSSDAAAAECSRCSPPVTSQMRLARLLPALRLNMRTMEQHDRMREQIGPPASQRFGALYIGIQLIWLFNPNKELPATSQAARSNQMNELQMRYDSKAIDIYREPAEVFDMTIPLSPAEAEEPITQGE